MVFSDDPGAIWQKPEANPRPEPYRWPKHSGQWPRPGQGPRQRHPDRLEACRYTAVDVWCVATAILAVHAAAAALNPGLLVRLLSEASQRRLSAWLRGGGRDG